MTFYPQQGTTSTEEFNSDEGAIFLNTGLQDIVNGYVTLINRQTGVFNLVRSWKPVSNWSINNNLYNLQTTTGTFGLLTGLVSGQSATVSGTYGIPTDATAWSIDTSYNYPTLISGAYSGAGSFALYLNSGTPDKQLYFSIVSGSQATTFEFDVASYIAYSGLTGLDGFSLTQNNLTGLPALSGLVSHGFLYSNGSNWDFIEINPYGIRSLNHPDLAIPMNMLSPRRIRIGFKNNDIYMSTQDGRTVVGYNKFDAVPYYIQTGGPSDTSQTFCAFGSITSGSILTTSHNGIMNSVKASYGRTLWDNIKVLTGQLAMYSETSQNFYTTGYATMYTSEFNPGVAINNYLNAVVKFIPFLGGNTNVYAQYSGLTGWVDFSSVALTGIDPLNINLTNFPVYSYPRADLGTDYISNPIRFKIEQRSTNGSSLPPAVESITVFCNKDRVVIDLLPDWKVRDSYVNVKASVQTGAFLTEDPVPERWSSFLLNVPYNTGLASGQLTTDEAKNLPVRIVGTGEFLLEGPYRSCFKNYADLPLTAVSGSEAFDYFGLEPVYNIFPNPFFEDGFRQITSGESNYYTGLTEGYLGAGTRITTVYTGQFKVDYIREQIYRPEAQARLRRTNSYLGYSTESNEYAQSVYVYPEQGAVHNGRVGIEAVVPSGIATGNLVISFDLQIKEGSGIQMSSIGSSTSSYILPGDYFRNYSNVSFITSTTNNNSFVLRFVIPSGYNADAYSFNIDNLSVSSYTNSFLSITGVAPALHLSGIAPTVLEASNNLPVYRSSTILYGSIYLDSYPVTTGIFAEVTGSSGKGLKLYINSNGYLGASIDQVHQSWMDNYLTNYEIQSLPKEELISNVRVPIGRWTTLGFMHDVHTYNNYSFVSVREDESSDPRARNFASTNKAYLTIDGYPVASKDLISGWTGQKTVSLVDSNPFITYVDITGSCRAVIASGLVCKVDGVHLLRPPVGELESELSIKGSRSYVPYFVPDFLYKGNDEDNNLLYHGPTGEPRGKDIYIGSCYNFSSPGYINFDKGPIRNHLLTYGSITKELNNPYEYSGIYSSRFYSGSYAVAPYSSSYERLQTNYSDTIIPKISGFNTNSIQAFGWIYPRTTGTFFQAIQQSSNLTGSRIELCVSTTNKLLLNKYNSSNNSIVFTVTGADVPLSGWSFVSFKFTSTGYTKNLNTGAVVCELSDGQDTYIYFNKTGIDFGFVYQGLSGRQGQSEIRFGGTSDINLFNWVLPISYTGDTDIERDYITSGNKGGRYQTILVSDSLYTGEKACTNYEYMKFSIGPSTAGDYYYSLAMLNSYDTIPKLYSINAYDDKPFKVINTYNLKYDTSKVESVFGAQDSPIRIGATVPASAINIAKFSSPEYTVSSSIASIDLSDYNPDNLNVYKQGNYLVGKSDRVVTSVVTGYKNINKSDYNGRIDVTISGQIVSSDIEVSTISLSSPESDFGYPAYYYYLIGRGNKGVKVPGTFAHYTGQINDFSTGTVPDNYIANLEKIKNSIKLKTADGTILDFDTYPYDIAISPYPVDLLQVAVASGVSFSLDNIGSYYTGNLLPNNVFTVILMTNRNTLDSRSVFVHYDAYDYNSKIESINYSEVVNPQPIYRERHPDEEKDIAKFDLTLDSNSYYNLTLYGIASGYNGKF